MAFLNIKVIDGGAERSDSIAKALEVVDPTCEFVAIHDAARPCLTAELVDAVFAAARSTARRCLAVPVADTIKRVGADRFTTETRPQGRPLPGADAAGLPPRAARARLRQPAPARRAT